MMMNSFRVSVNWKKKTATKTAQKHGYQHTLSNLVTWLPIFIIWLPNNITSHNDLNNLCYGG